MIKQDDAARVVYSWITGQQERMKKTAIAPIESQGGKRYGQTNNPFPHISEGSKHLPRKTAACAILNKKKQEGDRIHRQDKKE